MSKARTSWPEAQGCVELVFETEEVLGVPRPALVLPAIGPSAQAAEAPPNRAQRIVSYREQQHERRLNKIRQEMQVQRELIQRILEPDAKLEERLRQHREKERVERVERAERIRERYEKTRLAKEAKANKVVEEKLAAIQAEHEKKLAPLRGMLTPGSAGFQKAPLPSIEPKQQRTTQSSPPHIQQTAASSQGVGLSPQAAAVQADSAFHALQRARQAEVELQRAVAKRHEGVVGARRRLLRVILSSGEDKNRFVHAETLVIQSFARTRVSCWMAELRRRRDTSPILSLQTLSPSVSGLGSPYSQRTETTPERDARQKDMAESLIAECVESASTVLLREYLKR